MARFALGRDEDGAGDGSRGSSRPKRPRGVAPPRPEQPPPPPPRLLIRPEPPIAHEESEDEEDEENESDSEEGEESDEEEGEEEEDDDDDEGEEVDVTIVAEMSAPTHLVPARSARPRLSAQAIPQQFGAASTSLASNDPVQEVPRSVSPVKDGSLVFTLADPDVLDCLICYEPLTLPVFQCENGHIACCSCCIRSKNKCPSCTWPIGYNRCRAIEKVLESIRVGCQNAKHGCRVSVAYNKKHEHEKACMNLPCSCPHSGCSFISSCKQLYQHFSTSHANSATGFVYNKTFSVTLKIEERFIFLQEQTDGVLFILANETEYLGNRMSLQCIQPTFLAVFCYDIVAKTKGSCQRFQSLAKNTLCMIDSLPSTGYSIIPCDFFNADEQLKIDLCIWPGQSPAPVQLTSVA